MNHGDREQSVGCQRGGGGRGKDWEFGVSKGKLSPAGWVGSKALFWRRELYLVHYDKP